MPVRSEKEKMLAGESYNIFDPELVEQRARAKELCRLFNRTEAEPQRLSALRELLGSLGRNSIIEPPFYCSYGRNLHLGDHVFLNSLCVVLDNNEVRIGDHVMIGPGVHIYTAAHPLGAEARNEGWEVAKPVRVESNVWLGGGAILLPGVSVGSNAIVGAGAVVTRDVAANTVVAGNPAGVVRELEP